MIDKITKDVNISKNRKRVDSCSPTKENPWAGDKLDRKNFIENFYNIITSTDFPFVYSLEGGFGTGKTQCCKILESYIEHQEKEKCIYFNVWKSDFYDNPFHVILFEIANTLDINLEEKFPKILENIGRKITLNFGVASIPLGDINPKKECQKYETTKNEISSFKDQLKTRLEGKPLIIILDELDRCRPDYAIKTLEAIKHYFDIEGITFVLSIDAQQLGGIVKTIYGLDNFDGYIRKFVDYRFTLPEPNIGKQYTTHLYEAFDIETLLQSRQGKTLIIDNKKIKEIIITNFTLFSLIFNFNVRKQNHIFQKLFLLISALGKDVFFPELLIPLLFLYEDDSHKSKEIFYKFKDNSKSFNPIINYFKSLEDIHKNKVKIDKLKKEKTIESIDGHGVKYELMLQFAGHVEEIKEAFLTRKSSPSNRRKSEFLPKFMESFKGNISYNEENVNFNSFCKSMQSCAEKIEFISGVFPKNNFLLEIKSNMTVS